MDKLNKSFISVSTGPFFNTPNPRFLFEKQCVTPIRILPRLLFRTCCPATFLLRSSVSLSLLQAAGFFLLRVVDERVKLRKMGEDLSPCQDDMLPHVSTIGKTFRCEEPQASCTNDTMYDRGTRSGGGRPVWRDICLRPNASDVQPEHSTPSRFKHSCSFAEDCCGVRS